MGLRFIGAAIQECQEQTLIPVHAATLPQALIDLGFTPSWEAIAGTLALAYGKPTPTKAPAATPLLA